MCGGKGDRRRGGGGECVRACACAYKQSNALK